jgi:hypothetical protein
MLNQMWFELYHRDGSRDSSGFEHVFVGEHDISDGEWSTPAGTAIAVPAAAASVPLSACAMHSYFP